MGLGQTVAITSSRPFVVDRFIGIDPFKNTYFIKDRILHKEGDDGNYVYNALQLGRITSVDIINPLKVVVFFQDTNTVVLLDNKLNEIERITFNNLRDFLNVGTATNAGNNNLWLFNMDTQQLEIYNYREKRQTVVSQPLPGKLISQASNFNYCFTLTEDKLRAFNIYGSLLNQIAHDGFERIAQFNENLVAVKDDSLFYITDFARRNGKPIQETVKLEIPAMPIKDLHLTNDFLYIYDGKNLHTFTLTLPKKE